MSSASTSLSSLLLIRGDLNETVRLRIIILILENITKNLDNFADTFKDFEGISMCLNLSLLKWFGNLRFDSTISMDLKLLFEEFMFLFASVSSHKNQYLPRYFSDFYGHQTVLNYLVDHTSKLTISNVASIQWQSIANLSQFSESFVNGSFSPLLSLMKYEILSIIETYEVANIDALSYSFKIRVENVIICLKSSLFVST
jgi:hypothetical protein